jgi:redox-sensing transcriptional repressor|uniref:Redox-sensing transcriptional repressor Rex n=1 Tax=uncultured Armatimonadetes bacterium TaxID=157466 RepID=A0A6J4KA15_9BACT|nr:Redox-sensing transcriptional repressor Rex [uncultured Armatimonadetes bacterium]
MPRVDSQRREPPGLSSASKVPIPTLERLTTYLRCLIDLGASGVETVSSAEIEHHTGINAAQFRKDLSYFGEFGKPGVGYNVAELEGRIARILQIHRVQPILLVGAGNLGSALLGYPGLKEHKFHIVAAFDNDPHKIGKKTWDIDVFDLRRIGEVNEVLGARIAILAVPAGAAQAVTEQLVEAGVRAILNFAPIILRVPRHVAVRNVSFLQELAVLSYHLTSDPLAADK